MSEEFKVEIVNPEKSFLVKDDVSEVKNGSECGMGIKNYKDIRPKDKIEVFDRKEEAQTIS